MPLKTYGVLRGRVVDHRIGTAANAHFQLHVVDAAGTDFRVAINVKSDLAPSELEFLVDSDFRHPILPDVAALASGWTALERRAGGVALDFIRGNLFDRERLRTLPFDVPGPDNDLNEKLALYVRRAIADAGRERVRVRRALADRRRTCPTRSSTFAPATACTTST